MTLREWLAAYDAAELACMAARDVPVLRAAEAERLRATNGLVAALRAHLSVPGDLPATLQPDWIEQQRRDLTAALPQLDTSQGSNRHAAAGTTRMLISVLGDFQRVALPSLTGDPDTPHDP